MPADDHIYVILQVDHIYLSLLRGPSPWSCVVHAHRGHPAAARLFGSAMQLYCMALRLHSLAAKAQTARERLRLGRYRRSVTRRLPTPTRSAGRDCARACLFDSSAYPPPDRCNAQPPVQVRQALDAGGETDEAEVAGEAGEADGIPWPGGDSGLLRSLALIEAQVGRFAMCIHIAMRTTL